jgi:hypothetical protein
MRRSQGPREVRLRAEGRPAHLRQPQRAPGADVGFLRACGLRALFRVAGRATGGASSRPTSGRRRAGTLGWSARRSAPTSRPACTSQRVPKGAPALRKSWPRWAKSQEGSTVGLLRPLTIRKAIAGTSAPIPTISSQAGPRPSSQWPRGGLAPKQHWNQERCGSRETARRTGKPCSRGAGVWSDRPRRRVRPG